MGQVGRRQHNTMEVIQCRLCKEIVEDPVAHFTRAHRGTTAKLLDHFFAVTQQREPARSSEAPLPDPDSAINNPVPWETKQLRLDEEPEPNGPPNGSAK